MIKKSPVLATPKLHEPFTMVRMTDREVKAKLGAQRFTSLLKNKWFSLHTPQYKERAYKLGVDKLGYFELEVYSYGEEDKVEGKYKPKTFVRFHFAGYKVTQAHLFKRSDAVGEPWVWKYSWKDDND